MTHDILTAAGILHERGRFLRMPTETHAVWFDDLVLEGADRVPSASLPRLYTHNVTIELYEPKPDDKAEAALEAELNANGLLFTKQDRFWLPDAQRYQVVYEYSYTSKT